MLLFMYLSQKKKKTNFGVGFGLSKILVHVSLPRSPNYSVIWKPQSYLIQPLENPECGCLVGGYQTHHESWALGCLAVLLLVSNLPPSRCRTRSRGGSLWSYPVKDITGLILVLTRSTATNVVFSFSLCMYVQGKSTWRLEVLLPVETQVEIYRKHAVHLKMHVQLRDIWMNFW